MLSKPLNTKIVPVPVSDPEMGPKWDATKQEERNTILKQHLGNVISMLDSGKAAVMAGPLGDHTGLAGIFCSAIHVA